MTDPDFCFEAWRVFIARRIDLRLSVLIRGAGDTDLPKVQRGDYLPLDRGGNGSPLRSHRQDCARPEAQRGHEILSRIRSLILRLRLTGLLRLRLSWDARCDTEREKHGP